MQQSAIAVFDSGIGGLSVLSSLRTYFPHEKFIYLGDTARLPYGSKSPEAILKYTLQALRFFAPQNCKAIVIACNSASSQFQQAEFSGIPVYTVIAPGAASALTQSLSGRIGVLGTRATIQSGAYQKELLQLAKLQGKKIEVFTQAAPLFVPLVEEGWIDDPITNLIAFRYLQPLLQNNIDTLILGCTHYPLLKSTLQKVCTASIQLVDSGDALAAQMQLDFQQGRKALAEPLAKSGVAEPLAEAFPIELFATDSSLLLENFAQALLLGAKIEKLQLVELT